MNKQIQSEIVNNRLLNLSFRFTFNRISVLFSVIFAVVLATGCHKGEYTSSPKEGLENQIPERSFANNKPPKSPESLFENPERPMDPGPATFAESDQIPGINKAEVRPASGSTKRDSNKAASFIELAEPKPVAAPLFRILPFSKDSLPKTTQNDLEEFKPDTIVVCQKQWLPELQDWFEYRRMGGHQFGVVLTPISKEQLQNAFRFHFERNLKSVLLVGDVDVKSVVDLYNFTHRVKIDKKTIQSSRTWKIQNSTQKYQIHGIPTGIIPSKVGQKLKSEIYVASDNWLVDFDQDGAPEVAIGRWPVTEPGQIKPLIAKTIAYESSELNEMGSDRVEVVACGGGYGFFEDKLIESVTKQLLSQLIPADLRVHMTYASWRSVYCPSPGSFQKSFFQSLNRPSLFWVYIGHGAPWAIDVATFPNQLIPTLNKRTVRKMQPGGHPIAILIACSTGYFAGQSDSLSERMVLHPNGPVAVFSGSGVTAPYGLSNLAFELLSDFRSEESESIGQWILKAKKSTVENRSLNSSESKSRTTAASKFRSMLDQLGKLFSPTGKFLRRERIEHAHMMTLFGDPLLRLPQKKSFPVSVKQEGKNFVISGTAVKAGRIRMEIVHPRDKIGFRPKRRSKKKISDPAVVLAMDEEYRKANNRLIALVESDSESKDFSIRWTPEKPITRKFWIRATQQTANGVFRGFTIWDPVTESKKQEKKKAAKKDDKRPKPILLFDGKSSNGWKAIDFSGEEEIQIDKKQIRIEAGFPLAGIVYTGTKSFPVEKFPNSNYELQIKAKKEDGEDFFCGVTFPVGKSSCSFIPGGWGGSLTGLSSIDGVDASGNKTKTFQNYRSNKFYDIRIRVTDQKVQCWIDKKKVVDQVRKGVKFSIRGDVNQTKPLGICNFQTTSVISSIQLIKLNKTEKPKK